MFKQRSDDALKKIVNLKKRLNCTKECGMVKLNCSELDAIIDSSYDGIYVTDGKANTLMINKSYENITGLQRKDMLNKNMNELEKEGYISKSSTLMVIKRWKILYYRAGVSYR